MVSARGALNVALHDYELFSAPASTYGLVRVEAENPSGILFTEVLRLRNRADTLVDFTVPVPVR